MNRATVLLFLFALAAPDLFALPVPRARAPAEWEEVQGVVLGWFEADFLWQQSQAKEFGGWTETMIRARREFVAEHVELVAALLQTGVEVYILDDTTNSYSLPDTLSELGLEAPEIHVVPFVPSYREDRIYKPWLRDNGPFSVYREEVESLQLLGWRNDVGGEITAGFMQKSLHTFDTDAGYYTDGGNYIVDGRGRLFYDSRYQPESPRERKTVWDIWKESFGIEELVELPPYQIHLDYYLKLVNEETFFVSEIPGTNYLGNEQRSDDQERIEAAVETIRSRTLSRSGRPYRFVRIANSPSRAGSYETVDATYINSLIINATVIVPTFDHPPSDTEALQLYEKHMPGYRILAVPSSRFAERGGGIHCAAREIYADDPLLIVHDRLPDSVPPAGGYEIDARIQSASGIADAVLHWRAGDNGRFEQVPMAYRRGDRFTATIPGQPPGTQVQYYVEAAGNDGKRMTKPMVAPEWAHRFNVVEEKVSTEVSGPAAGATAGEISLSQNFPNPFNHTTGIDCYLPEPAEVEISVYDLGGRKIRTLVRGFMPRGKQTVRWDASGLASGVYLYRIRSGNFEDVRRATLIR